MGKKANSQPESSPDHPKDEAYLQTVISKRIAVFESIKAQQLAHRQSIAGDPIKITLPDGSVKEGKKWLSTPLDIAKEISKSLAANALISKVNGVLWDMSRPLEGDCDLKLFTFDSDEGRDTFWHSSDHILGQSLEMEYGCKLCIGPCTTRGEGYYYDAFYGDLGLNEDHFKRIDSGAAKAVGENSLLSALKLQGIRLLRCSVKINIRLKSLMNYLKTKLSPYTDVVPLVDLCRGPHIPNTSFVKAFACLKASSAYWRGNKDRESLQRVYGISYPDQKRLKEYIARLEEGKKYDHRELGKNQELFFFHPLSCLPSTWCSNLQQIGGICMKSKLEERIPRGCVTKYL